MKTENFVFNNRTKEFKMTESIEKIESILASCKPYKGQEKLQVVVIGPEQAKQLLALNDEHNRTLKGKNIKRYAEYMQENEFLLSNDAITIDENGVHINGQNRLSAVVKTGCSAPFIVLYNVPPETKNIINNGVIVTNRDRQKMFLEEIGMKKKDAWGTICEILSAETGGLKKKEDFTMNVNEVKQFANSNHDVLEHIFNRDYVKKNQKGKPKMHFGITNAPVAMRLEFMLTQRSKPEDRVVAKQFFDDIDTQNRPFGSPVGVLQEWFRDDNREAYAGHGGESAEIAIMIAFDAYKKWQLTGKSGIKAINVFRKKVDSNGNPVIDPDTNEAVSELNRDYLYLNYMKNHK